MGQLGIADVHSQFIQPGPDVLQAVAGRQQIADVRPCLADLAGLGARFFPQSCAEAIQIEVLAQVDIHRLYIVRPQKAAP